MFIEMNVCIRNQGGNADISVPGMYNSISGTVFLCSKLSCRNRGSPIEIVGIGRYVDGSKRRNTMRDKLEAIKAEALAKIESAEVVSSLNDVKVAILGKKGELTQVLKSMKDVAPEDRPKVGQMVNEARQAIETALDEKTKSINRALRAEKMKRETIDVTLPGVKKLTGHRHPNKIALEDLERVFIGMGYEIVEGPEVEYDKYNFELLNIPANHPAKDEQDTF